jgi:hypothetical protein
MVMLGHLGHVEADLIAKGYSQEKVEEQVFPDEGAVAPMQANSSSEYSEVRIRNFMVGFPSI